MNLVRSLGLVAGLSFVAACSGAAGPDVVSPGAPPGEDGTFASMRSSAILAAAMAYPPTKAVAEEAPISLTSSDGEGLALTSLDARAVAEGPLAFTELHLSFENPQNRVIEGRFSITLPPGATVSRLAMKNAEGWQEAEVVERQLARRAYEDALHRRQDPALLEKEAGNEFRARVFPIQAKASKEIIVSYSQESLRVSAIASRSAACRRSGTCGSLPTSATIGAASKRRRSSRTATSRPPCRRSRPASAPTTWPWSRIRPELGSEKAELGDLVILFDTSASRALGFTREVERLGRLVGELAKSARPGAELTLATFDQTVDRVYRGPISAFSRRDLDAILARRPLGATNLAGAIASLGRERAHARAILITDGVATAGGADAAVAETKKLRGRIDRLDVVLSGGIRDDDLAKRLARGTLERDGVVLDGGRDLAETARRIALATCSGISVDVAGASWVWPARLDGLQPGDQAFVYALMKKGAPVAKLSVSLGGGVKQTLDLPAIQVEKPLLERAAANAEIARLTATRDALPADDASRRADLERQIVKISTTFRVVSDFTALLVLESDSDYARFGIDRRALADVLTIGNRGLTLLHRSEPVVVLREPTPPPRSYRAAADNKPATKKPAKEALQGRSAGEAFKQKAEEPMEHAVNGAPAGGASTPRSPQDETRTGEAAGKKNDKDRGEGRRPAAWGGVAPPAESEAPKPEPPPPPAVAAAPRPQASAQGNEAPRASLEAPPAAAPATPRAMDAPQRFNDDAFEDDSDASDEKGPPPYTGKMADVMELLAAGKVERAIVNAVHWQNEEPGNVVALVALGESLEAAGNRVLAARAYGSILNLFPQRADMRRFAAERLERIGGASRALATDAFAKAAADRPDHLNGHRLYAFALLRDGRVADAFAEIEAGLSRSYPPGRFLGGDRILRDDLGLVAAAWLKIDPKRRPEIEARLARFGVKIPTEPSLRFVLYWETDANDVDFHIHDAKGGHAFYRHKALRSGGELYADVTTGYGPECFTIEGTPRAYPYRLQIHYYSRGPMGYGMGKLGDHRARRQGRAEVRGAAVRRDERSGVRGSRAGERAAQVGGRDVVAGGGRVVERPRAGLPRARAPLSDLRRLRAAARRGGDVARVRRRAPRRGRRLRPRLGDRARRASGRTGDGRRARPGDARARRRGARALRSARRDRRRRRLAASRRAVRRGDRERRDAPRRRARGAPRHREGPRPRRALRVQRLGSLVRRHGRQSRSGARLEAGARPRDRAPRPRSATPGAPGGAAARAHPRRLRRGGARERPGARLESTSTRTARPPRSTSTSRRWRPRSCRSSRRRSAPASSSSPASSATSRRPSAPRG